MTSFTRAGSRALNLLIISRGVHVFDHKRVFDWLIGYWLFIDSTIVHNYTPCSMTEFCSNAQQN